MINLRVIGDVHGRVQTYLELCRQAEMSVQVGDLSSSHFDFFNTSDLNPEKHRFFCGNHDNYPLAEQSPHNMGDFGVFEVPGWGRVFFMRGAFSIDRNQTRRIIFPEEELSYNQSLQAIELYEQTKPDILLTHDCAKSTVLSLSNKEILRFFGWDHEPLSITQQTIEVMIESHRPKYHVFGHHHRWYHKKLDGTYFICLPKMALIDFNDNGNISFDQY